MRSEIQKLSEHTRLQLRQCELHKLTTKQELWRNISAKRAHAIRRKKTCHGVVDAGTVYMCCREVSRRYLYTSERNTNAYVSHRRKPYRMRFQMVNPHASLFYQEPLPGSKAMRCGSTILQCACGPADTCVTSALAFLFLLHIYNLFDLWRNGCEYVSSRD